MPTLIVFAILTVVVFRLAFRIVRFLPFLPAPRPVRYEPPRGLGLRWLPDRAFRAFADPQRPPDTFDF